jgi:hypothetical protein
MKAWHLNSDITKNLTQSWSFTCHSQTNGQIIHSQSSIGWKSMKYIGKKRVEYNYPNFNMKWHYDFKKLGIDGIR